MILKWEGIILSMPQKGLFSLADLFIESLRETSPTTNSQPSLDDPAAGIIYLNVGRDGPDATVLERPHSGSTLGPLFQNHLLDSLSALAS